MRNSLTMLANPDLDHVIGVIMDSPLLTESETVDLLLDDDSTDLEIGEIEVVPEGSRLKCQTCQSESIFVLDNQPVQLSMGLRQEFHKSLKFLNAVYKSIIV